MSKLQHSAKGTSWTKKDHKYVKKENGRYYYKDDMKQKQIDEKSDTLDFSEYAAKNANNLATEPDKLPEWVNRMAEQVARQDSAFAFKEGEEEWVRQWAVNSARRKILERMPELEKTKKGIQNSKILKEASKAAKSVAKAYVEVKNEKVKEQKQTELLYSHMNEAVKKVGSTKITGSTKQNTSGELIRRANASAQKARLNRANSKNWDDKGYRNPSDKRYYE